MGEAVNIRRLIQTAIWRKINAVCCGTIGAVSREVLWFNTITYFGQQSVKFVVIDRQSSRLGRAVVVGDRSAFLGQTFF